MGQLTEDQLRLAAGTDRDPLRPKLLHQLSMLADRRAACHDAALSARKIGPGQAVPGQGTGLYMGAGLPQTAGALAVHLVELVTRIPDSRPPKEPRRTWSPLMSDPTLNRPDPTQQVAGRLHRSSSLKRSRILTQRRGACGPLFGKGLKVPTMGSLHDSRCEARGRNR
jgi:hypothetical protein